MALAPDDRAKGIEGTRALAKNGIRFPFPQCGIRQDARAGTNASPRAMKDGPARGARSVSRRTSIGQKRIAVGELFTVFGEDGDSSLDDGDDVREIAHVTTQAA